MKQRIHPSYQIWRNTKRANKSTSDVLVCCLSLRTNISLEFLKCLESILWASWTQRITSKDQPFLIRSFLFRFRLLLQLLMLFCCPQILYYPVHYLLLLISPWTYKLEFNIEFSKLKLEFGFDDNSALSFWSFSLNTLPTFPFFLLLFSFLISWAKSVDVCPWITSLY